MGSSRGHDPRRPYPSKRKSRRRLGRLWSKNRKILSAIKLACEKEKSGVLATQSHSQADNSDLNHANNQGYLGEGENIQVKCEDFCDGQILEQPCTESSEFGLSGVGSCEVNREEPSESQELNSCGIKLEEPSEGFEFCDVKLEVPCSAINRETNCNKVVTSKVNILPTIICCRPAQTKFNLASSNLQDSQVLVKNKGPWTEFIKSDKQLKSATGIESFNLLGAIVEWMKVATQNKYERDSVLVKTENRVLMTYLKLKQNLKYNFLALMFDHVTGEQCKHIFQETVKTLSKCMETVVQWLPRNRVFRDQPKCFQNFENLRVITECIEICMEIQKKRSCRRDLSQSPNTSSTARAILGVSPAAVITFISKASHGNWDESSLFEGSKLPQLLEEQDNVIVGDDFPIEALKKQYKFHCIQNPFRLKDSVTEKDLALYQEIKKAREIIDKVHLQIKEFQILNSLPSELVVCLDQILMIVSGTINLSTPIISKDILIRAK